MQDHTTQPASQVRFAVEDQEHDAQIYRDPDDGGLVVSVRKGLVSRRAFVALVLAFDALDNRVPGSATASA